MAAQINRFDKPQVYDYNLEYAVPKEFMPNLEAWDDVLGKEQANFDALGALQAQVPKHLKKDREGVESYMMGIKDRIKEVSTSYAQNGLSQGRRDRVGLLQEIRRDWMPGGKAKLFEENLQSYTDYKGQLDKMFEKGDINSRKRDLLLAGSMNNFAGTFSDAPDGSEVHSEFSGITAAHDQDLADQANTLVKGWMSDKVNSGTFKVMNGQYFNLETKEYVNPKEVYEHVYNQLANKPENQSYLAQEADLLGFTGKDKETYMKQLLHEASNFGAQKAGFSKVDNELRADWMLKEEIKQKNRYKLADYEYNLGAGEISTELFTVDSGMVPLKLSAFDGTPGGSTSTTDITGAGERGWIQFTGKRDGGPEMSIEDYADSAAGREKHPGLYQLTQQFPRKREGNTLENNKNYNARIKRMHDSKRKSMSIGVGKLNSYGNKQMEERKASVIGKGKALGDITHKTIILKSPGKTPVVMNWERFRKTHKINAEDFIERTNILGTKATTSPLVPAGEEAVYTDKKGRSYNFIISNTNNQDAAMKQPVFTLSSGLHDGSVYETDQVFVRTDTDGSGVILNATYDDIYDEVGNFQNRRASIRDNNGNNLTYDDATGELLPNPVTLEQIDEMVSNSNIFDPHNFKGNKTGSIIIKNTEKVKVPNE